MAQIVKVETTKPKVKSVTLELNLEDVYDMQDYIKNWYKSTGYGSNQHTMNGLWKVLAGALEGTAS